MKEIIKFNELEKKVIALLAFSIVYLMIPLHVFAANNDFYGEITSVTGFNVDVVADNETDLINNTEAVDRINGDTTGARYIVSSYAPNENANSKGFFPAGKVITTTTGKKFILQPSNTNNALKVYKSLGTQSLNLNVTQKYEKLAILLLGGNGSVDLSVTVEYTGNTKSSSQNCTAYDWYTGPSNKKIYSGLWRTTASHSIEKQDWQGLTSGMYEYTINVDPTKIVKKLNFTSNTNSAYAIIFGVSGVIDKNNVKEVKFNTNGGSSVDTQILISGNKAVMPSNPTKDTYDFDGWYSDANLTTLYDFNTVVNNNITLYAKWKEKEKGKVVVNDSTTSNDIGATISNSNNLLSKITLNDEETYSINNGKNISIYLEVKDISDSVPAEEKEKIEKEFKENDILGMYIDVSLFKKIDGEDPIEISETKDEIEISFEIPEHLRNTDPTIVRTYTIFKLHNGVVTPINVNLKGNIGTFKTKEFSTYALVYTDTKVENKVSNPNTKDNILFYISILILSIVGLNIVSIIKRKKD